MSTTIEIESGAFAKMQRQIADMHESMGILIDVMESMSAGTATVCERLDILMGWLGKKPDKDGEDPVVESLVALTDATRRNGDAILGMADQLSELMRRLG